MAATNPVKGRIDAGDPNKLGDFDHLLKMGAILRSQINQVIRKKVPAADGAQLATLSGLGCVAKGAPAASILRAKAYTGGVTAKELAPQAYGATPATGQIAVAPNGELVVLAADAWTDVDVTYAPERGDVITLPELPVAAGILTLPTSVLDAAGKRKAILLLSANLTKVSAGVVTGPKIILIPAGTLGAPALPATTKAQLSLDGLIVQFNDATDHGTAAIVSLLLVTADDLDTILESEAQF